MMCKLKRLRRLDDEEIPSDPEYSFKLWMSQMVEQEQAEAHVLEQVLESSNDLLRIEMDLDLESQRARKQFIRNPTAFLVKKMRDAEVHYGRLTGAQKLLFDRAKAKEVGSFLSNEAVRKCISDEEAREAMSSGKIIRARWVLTWKLNPPEDLEDARKDARDNPKSVNQADGSRKAKARIVLLGYEHPAVGSADYKTSSPVQSGLARSLLYQMVCQHGWSLEGLDLATAFLQTAPTSADEGMWTSGVLELREALGVGAEGIMKIMKNIYGSTTAPRGLWLSLHRKLSELGGKVVLGERCLWLWTSKHRVDSDGNPVPIGLMGGGDDGDPEWADIKKSINDAYKWGMAKTGAYRHAGTDVMLSKDDVGDTVVTVNQQYYVDALTDVDMSADRLRRPGLKLTPEEIGACRAALGTLQWLAIQTQPQLCARCNILLTELTKHGMTDVAWELQQMIGEVRRLPTVLRFFKLKKAETWRDVIFISMADQAHNNRPNGDSTGGMVTVISGPEALLGGVCPMVLLSWRTWKLKRKAISSNDAEVQAVLDAEDHNFRVRLLWSEMHGAGWHRTPQDNQVEWAERQVRAVRGVLCTDSRGGYDAVQVNESPMLGLSNTRSALQAMQLRENMLRTGSVLRWVASDYDLGDALTKKRVGCRHGLTKFIEKGMWSIAFDPSFTAAKKNQRQGRSAVQAVDDA